jgi:hypothetical protein
VDLGEPGRTYCPEGGGNFLQDPVSNVSKGRESPVEGVVQWQKDCP